MASKTDLQLNDMLNEHWLKAIGDTIAAQPDAVKYLGVKRDSATIPSRENTFASLNLHPPKDVNVVIFGQDPYPRAESAVGVAFNDGAIHKWTDKFSPSFGNIIKNLLIGAGHATSSQGIADVRKWLAKNEIAQPPQWFASTIKQGVCWLNTSLTFTSTDTSILAQHLSFWKPIIEAIISALIQAKRDLITSKTNPNAGIVFVLWGGHAQKLKSMVQKLNKAAEPQIALEFVDAPHPAATGASFHTVHSFASIDNALAAIGAPKIDWFPKATGEVASSSNSTATPSGRGKKRAQDEEPEKTPKAPKLKKRKTEE